MPSRTIRTALVASCAVLALAACREDSRSASAAVGYGVPPSALTYDMALAPEGQALPAAGRAPVGRLVSYEDEGYGWAERAYAMDRAFYDAPPDYGFAYEDVQPWAWESEDRWTLYAEPISDGYRYYYYEPGEAYPYFVRDDDYGYGYDDTGRLVTLYTVAGALLPVSYLDDRADMAGRYWRRAYDLRRAGARRERIRVEQTLWLARQPVIVRSQRPWMEAAERRDDWRAYRSRRDGRDLQRFEPERARRGAMVARLDREEIQRVGRVRGGEGGGGWAAAPAEPRRENDRVRSTRLERRSAERDGSRLDRDEPRRRQAALAQTDRRDRPDRSPREQVRAEGGRRGAEQGEARQEPPRRRVERAQAERRKPPERMPVQRARVEEERRGAGPAQVRHSEPPRQQAERGRRDRPEQVRAEQAHRADGRNDRARPDRRERPGRAQAQQARAEGERGGREQTQGGRKDRQEARNAAQGGRDAGHGGRDER